MTHTTVNLYQRILLEPMQWSEHHFLTNDKSKEAYLIWYLNNTKILEF